MIILIFDPNSLEQISKVISEYITGSKLTNMLENLNIRPLDDDYKCTKWRRIYNSIAIYQNQHKNGDIFIKVIEYIMAPINFHEYGKDKYESIVKELNELLFMSGLELNKTGKVTQVEKSDTLRDAESRAYGLKMALKPFNIHPQILTFCNPEILSENYFHLVFEATKCTLNHLRIISELTLDGNQLINECFSGKNPLLLINKFDTVAAQDEHKGLHSLLNLIVYWYRNPKAHTAKFFSDDSQEDAIAAIILISKARTLLDKCFFNPTRKNIN